jgi:hypothetical protein
VFLGEAAFGLLRENEVAVGDDVELALRAFDDARVDPTRVERGRETRGPAVVAASDGAVVDLDAHGRERTGAGAPDYGREVLEDVVDRRSGRASRRQIVLNCSNGCRQALQ